MKTELRSHRAAHGAPRPVFLCLEAARQQLLRRVGPHRVADLVEHVIRAAKIRGFYGLMGGRGSGLALLFELSEIARGRSQMDNALSPNHAARLYLRLCRACLSDLRKQRTSRYPSRFAEEYRETLKTVQRVFRSSHTALERKKQLEKRFPEITGFRPEKRRPLFMVLQHATPEETTRYLLAGRHRVSASTVKGWRASLPFLEEKLSRGVRVRARRGGRLEVKRRERLLRANANSR